MVLLVSRVTGLVKLEDRLLILLDIDKILGEEEADSLDAAMAGASSCS